MILQREDFLFGFKRDGFFSPSFLPLIQLKQLVDVILLKENRALQELRNSTNILCRWVFVPECWCLHTFFFCEYAGSSQVRVIQTTCVVFFPLRTVSTVSQAQIRSFYDPTELFCHLFAKWLYNCRPRTYRSLWGGKVLKVVAIWGLLKFLFFT